MSLYDRDFVRRLRRNAKTEIRRNPRWKAEERAARRAKHYSMESAFRFVIPLGAFLYAFWKPSTTAMLPILAVWVTCLILVRAGEIHSLLIARVGIIPFIQFPVSREFILAHIQRTVLRHSWFAAVDAAAVLAGLVLGYGSGHWIGVIAGAGLVWATILSVAVILVWRAPNFPAGAIVAVFGGVGFFVALAGIRAGLISPQALLSAYQAAKWWLPPGWVCMTSEWLVFGNTTAPLLPAGLLTGTFVLAAFGVQQLRTGFALWEPAWAAQMAAEAEDVGPPQDRVSEVEAQILERSFLAPQIWAGSGFIERLGFKLLTARERLVADFMLLSPPGWSSRYPVGCVFVALTPWLVQLPLPQAPWILAIGIWIGLAAITPLLGGGWAGFASAAIGHRNAAIFTLWPLGVQEVRACILKLNLVRFLCALPWWLYAGAGTAYFAREPMFAGTVIAAKCWLVCLLLQPFCLVFKFSAGTNDTSSGCLFTLGFFGLCICVVTCAIGAGILSFVGSQLAWWLGSLVALAFFSWFFEAAYRWGWRTQRFDLLAKAPPTPS